MDKMGPVIEELREKKLLKESDGAYVVDLEEYGMPPCLIIKSDGATLYTTRDLAAAFYRKKTYDFTKSPVCGRVSAEPALQAAVQGHRADGP